MKIKWQGFLAENHSWSIVGQNISRQLIKLDHEVDLISTNGLKHFPNDLKNNLRTSPQLNYDLQLTYTALKNFDKFLAHGIKNRFGIWCYEFAGKNSLPPGFAKKYKDSDLILPPSNFAKNVFADSGIPESAMKVIPHGYNPEKFENVSAYHLETKGTVRILANVAQPHIRKNLGGLLEVYGRTFSKKDDVCLVVKVVDKKASENFEVSFSELYKKFQANFPNHAEVKVITNFIDDIESLYKSCHILFMIPHSECFMFPALEALAAKMVVVTSNYGGQLDFLSNENSILVDGKEDFAPPNALYWQSRVGTRYFYPSIDDAVSKLRDAYENYDAYKTKFNKYSENILPKFTWKKVTEDILKLCR